MTAVLTPTPAPPREAGASALLASEPVVTEAPLPPSIILYDGVCGLCAKAVRWLITHDRGRLHYAPLQGETAARLRARHPRIPVELQSVVLVDGGQVYLRSKAFLHVARHLTRPWRWLYGVRWLPAFLCDPFYWVVAKSRYRLFGRYDACRLPTQGERARLLP